MLKAKSVRYIWLVVAALLSVFASYAMAAEVDCNACHEELSKGAVVHQALAASCTACHSAIDAKEVPHIKKGGGPRGLSLSEPALCHRCHDKSKFQGKVVHAALGMGCTKCHNPHSSKNGKLLREALPGLCFNCHDKAKFEKKFPHAPVAGGSCLDCHSVHASDLDRLLLKPVPELCYNCHDNSEFNRPVKHTPAESGLCAVCHDMHSADQRMLLKLPASDGCLQCHPKIDRQPHAARGSTQAGHPIRDRRTPKAKTGELSCATCHNPHSSDFRTLFRYKAEKAFDLCRNCHAFSSRQ